MLKTFIAVIALALAGCATTTGTSPPGTTTPKQAVYALQGAYRTALIPVATYVELPRCTATPKPPCSSSALVAQLQKAVKVAELAVDAADTAVYTPGFGTNAATTAVAAAQAALQALAAISPPAGGK